MTDALEIENPAETITRLEAEREQVAVFMRDRIEQLEGTLALIAAQASRGSLIHNLASQALARRCPGCNGSHHEYRWALWLNLSRRSLRRKRQKAKITTVYLTHEQAQSLTRDRL
jgi:hypothetical protein